MSSRTRAVNLTELSSEQSTWLDRDLTHSLIPLLNKSKPSAGLICDSFKNQFALPHLLVTVYISSFPTLLRTTMADYIESCSWPCIGIQTRLLLGALLFCQRWPCGQEQVLWLVKCKELVSEQALAPTQHPNCHGRKGLCDQAVILMTRNIVLRWFQGNLRERQRQGRFRRDVKHKRTERDWKDKDWFFWVLFCRNRVLKAAFSINSVTLC